MSDKYVFVEYRNYLNEVINQAIQLTQRLKYTCYDVSAKYMVFGASSGGLYVFSRWPCNFLKLIPNNEGSIVQVAISPDEKSIAFATAKGLVIVLEECFVDINYNYQQFAEHEGNVVTVIKWQNSEIYCGDNTGKVSVITVANLLTKAIFQIPCATLMTLDTSIIQIDSYSKYLLVSTITRTFLCDTEKEQYRQIGKKLREGIFGACFAPIIEKPKSTNDQRIVCSRPGARLWQADFDATVTCTHHFKNIASQKPASIVHLEDVCDAHLSVTDYTTCDYELPETFNFGKVLGVARKFILTYTSDIVYIIDPHHATLLFWTNYYSGIQDIKVVNNYIYIQLENFHIETLFVSVLEDLILDTLFKKQYFFCAELCVHFAEDVLTLISTSNRIHLITILEEKLINARCNYLLDQIVPVLDKIREFSEAQFVARKLEGGVVTVENAYYAENKFYEQKSDTLQVLKELTEGSENIKEKLQCLEDKVKKAKIEEVIMEKKDTLDVQTTVKCTAPSETLCFTDTANNLKVLRKHYELNKINAQVETQRMKDLFGSKNVDSVVELLEGFVESSLVEITEREQVQAWCYTQFLKHLIRNEIPVDETIFNYTERAFVTLNVTKQFSCVCGYPLPQAKNKLPDFLIIGCKICQYLQERNKPLTGITNNVPYMWKYVITELNIAEFLPLILQLSDNDLFKAFYNKFTYDIWDEATNLLVKLKKAVCLNCDAKIETSGVITWSDFANLMLQSIGSISTAKLLKRYAKWIPNGDLDGSFYQTCIFSTALDNLQQDFRSEAVNFSTEMFSDKEMSLQMSELISKYLHRKHTRQMSCDSAVLPVVKDYKELCGFCELPLNIEILEDVFTLKCNHIFHRICLIHNNHICCVCKIAVD